MRKVLAIVSLATLIASFSMAGDLKVLGYDVFGNERGIRGLSFDDVDPTIGIAWYWDVDVDSFAYYAQLPVVKYKYARINFGAIVPVGKDNITEHSHYFEWKTRPLFGVSCTFGDMIENLPEICPLEVGGYAAVGPYEAYGVQLGLIRIKW